MCERAEPTGDVFNRYRFDARLIDYKDENFILGQEDAVDRSGEEEDDGDDGSSSANTVTDADLDDDDDSDDEEGEEGDVWEEPDKDEGALGNAVNLFGLKNRRAR